MLPKSVEVVGLIDIGITEDIPETGETLKENAAIKARYVYNKTGMSVFSDDTGLEVDALNGAPGVYSARYAGDDKDTNENNNKLLRELEGVSERAAQFRSVFCLIDEGVAHYFEGIVRGEILLSTSGSEGFGYDPVFKPEEANVSFAEMSAEDKNAISHRGRALRKLVHFVAHQSSKNG